MFDIKRSALTTDEFDRVLFVFKARSNTSRHPFAAVVHVEWTRTGSRLVACDGLRLHVTEVKRRIPRGNYKPAVSKDSISFGEPVSDIVFPEWKNFVPEAPVRKGTLNLEKTGMRGNAGLAAGMSVAFNDLVKKTGELINLRYLDDLPKKEWTVSIHKDRETLILLEAKNAGRETYAVFIPLAKAA